MVYLPYYCSCDAHITPDTHQILGGAQQILVKGKNIGKIFLICRLFGEKYNEPTKLQNKLSNRYYNSFIKEPSIRSSGRL